LQSFQVDSFISFESLFLTTKPYPMKTFFITLLLLCSLGLSTVNAQLRMFYIKGSSLPYSIYSSNLDGSDEQLVVSGVMINMAGFGGGKIAFYTGAGINVVNLDGSGEISVPNTDNASYGFVDCSQDGNRIVYTAFDFNSQIYMIDMDGTNKILFNDGSLISQHQNTPSWNEPGKIYMDLCQYGDPFGQKIYWKPEDDPTAAPIQITDIFGQNGIPGGPNNLIAFNGPYGALFMMNSDGSGVVELLNAGDTAWAGAWENISGYHYYTFKGNIGKIKPDDTGNTLVTSTGDILNVLGFDYVPLTAAISIPDTLTTINKSVEVPVICHTSLTAIENITSCRFKVTYDPGIVTYAGKSTTGTLFSSGSADISETVPGSLVIDFSSSSPLTGAGRLLKLIFQPVRTGLSELDLSEFLFNADTIHDLNDGSIEVIFQGIQATVFMNDTIVPDRVTVKMPVWSTIPLLAEDDILSYRFNLSYDAEIVTFLDKDLDGTIITGGSLDIIESIPGSLTVSCQAQAPITGEGTIANLYFKTIDAGISTLDLADFFYNYDTIKSLVDGSIEVIPQNIAIEIPSAFTPNDDGINDLFEIETEGITKAFAWIKDSWGRLIIEFDAVTGNWDGTNESGKEAPAGPYFYHLEAEDYAGAALQRSGVVYLVRELVELSPNPVIGMLKVDTKGQMPGDKTLKIVSAAGQVLMQQKASGEIIELDLTGLEPSVYLLQISNGQDQLNLKFIKQ
jgi:gliding motility-associated-like protein